METPQDAVVTEKVPLGASTSIDVSSRESKESLSKRKEAGISKLPSYDPERTDDSSIGDLDTAEDIVTTVIHVDDNPDLNPWTFRMFFIGMGLSAFAAVLQEIFYFKPQTIFVSAMFINVLAYALGEIMQIIPRWGPVGRFLNPHPWNRKEHTAAVIMASAAAVSALSTEALAVQKLYYGGYPNEAAGIFITLSSQLLGYGIAGMMRSALLYPTKMLWPASLPITTVMETLHSGSGSRKRYRVFWIVVAIMFVWEWFPEYIFPLLTGFSIFCLADQHNLVFTNIFGGSQGNEGMGILSFCFDWNYIAPFGSPLFIPLSTQVNSCIGYLAGAILSLGIFYTNVWRSGDFPFMSQLLFDGSSNSTNWVTYDLTTIFNPDFTINNTAIDAAGVPFMTGSYAASLITTNMGTTATIVHMFLWNYHEIKEGWNWATLDNLKKLLQPATYAFWRNYGTRTQEEKERILNNPDIDPHYKKMIDYDEVPNVWYFLAFAASWITGLTCLYVMKSTLPWWGFIMATIFTIIFMLFFGAQYAITGFGFNFQPVFQMLGGYMFPGRPLANMYFTTFTYNTVGQGQNLLRDLKIAQQNKLSPKCTFVTQMIGCLFGALLNWVMMTSIVQNQGPVLTSIQGTNIWSGQNIQQFNTLAIAWSIAPKMFSVGSRYQWVTIAYLLGFLAPIPFYVMSRFFPKQRIWSLLNTSIIIWYLGWLFVGINSGITMYFILGFGAQWWLRKYHPKYFVKWNYLISAALDGGTQIMVFISTFAVQGGSGTAHPFPVWAGNRANNFDYCMYNPANG